jgi:hypothetical protein
MSKFFKQKSNQFWLVIPGILIVGFIQNAAAQETFPKPPRRFQNELAVPGSYLKTIYNFSPTRYDTVPQSGPDPLLLARYQDDRLIPLIFDAVLSNRISVYNPNFWGSVPQLIEKENYEKFDTLKVLNYLSAGWDTSLMIDRDGSMETIPEYREIPYEEISGLFFYESWWLDQKSNRLFKDVHAYLPIREYLASVYEGYENTEIRKRLLFMILPDWSTGSEKPVKYRPKDFQLLWKNIDYRVELYNKPYNRYLYREEEYGEISKLEYNQWQYHFFDFYRYFDANLFLEKIINGILTGKLKASKHGQDASKPGQDASPLNQDEFLKLLRNLPEGPGFKDLQDSVMLSENYPLTDLNSIVFHEDWYINPENLQIYKDVKGITVNRHENRYDNYTGEFIQGTVNPLFTVWFE